MNRIKTNKKVKPKDKKINDDTKLLTYRKTVLHKDEVNKLAFTEINTTICKKVKEDLKHTMNKI